MSQESKNIVINNYFIIKPEDFPLLFNLNSKEDGRLNKLLSIFQPIQKCHSIKTSFLKHKRQGVENKIIINEDQFNDVNLNINSTDKNFSKIEENFPSKTTNLSIEINDDKNIKSDLVENSTLAKKAYFEINSKKKIGRKPKNSITKSVHTKFSHDNILRKIKVKFLHKIVNYMNRLIISKYNKKIHMLKHLKGKISQDNSINFNKILLISKLKDVFSSNEINGKYKLFEKFYNKEIIEKIYEEKITELIDILEMTFLDAFIIFKNENTSEKLDGFEKLDKVIEELKLKEKNEEYIQEFEKVAMNFENYYLNKVGRKYYK